MKITTAMILAGGLGTRLRSVVNDVPKPMAKVAGKPWLTYLVAYLKTFGIQEIVLCVGHLAHVVEEYFGDGASLDIKISYSYEDKPLGTAGAFAAASPKINEDVFLGLNGDSFCPVDIRGLIHQHQQLHTLATLTVTRVNDVGRYGNVQLDSRDRITCFQEKSHEQGHGLANAGIYVLTRQAMDQVPQGQSCSIERQIFPNLIAQGLGAYVTDASLIDIGTPESYLSAANELARLWPDVLRHM